MDSVYKIVYTGHILVARWSWAHPIHTGQGMRIQKSTYKMVLRWFYRVAIAVGASVIH